MKVTKINIEGVLILEPKVFQDERGYFQESFNQKSWEQLCGNQTFVQDNESKSSYGVIRGLHYQLNPNAQAKLVRVVLGKVKDVIIDLRKDSKTFGEKFEIILSEENKKQFFIPKGFAHGFAVLSETAIFSYKCDGYYNKESERGINPMDPVLNIDWGIAKKDSIISEKDASSPSWEQHHPFV